MSITAGPLLNLKILLDFWRMNIPCDGLPWLNISQGMRIFFYNRGMWAMREGVKFILRKKGKKTGHIWIPDYFCNDALYPFRTSSFKLSFYPVKKDLSPNWREIERLLESQDKPDIFVLVHYFGFPNKILEAEDFCKKYDLVLIEDAAHVLVPTSNIGKRNVTIYSPRKLLPVPEGGLLIMPNGKEQNEVKMPYEGKQDYREKNHDTDLLFFVKWIVRSVLKLIVVKMKIPWSCFKNYFSYEIKKQGSTSDDKYFQGHCASYTLKMLSATGKNISNIVQKRRLNYLQLSKLLEGVKDVSLLFPFLPVDVSPYAFPLLLLRDKDRVIQILNKHYGIPASNWPDIPPEVVQFGNRHESAIWLKEHIILLPVHQSLNQRHISYIANSLKEILNFRF